MLADVMTNNQLMIEADGGLLVFPMSSVKYIQLSGLGLSEFDGAQLPRMIIRNATIVN